MGPRGPAAPVAPGRVTFPQRIERLLAEHRLEAAQFDDREIVGLWTRAVTSYRDAGVAGLSEEGAFTRAYDAGRQAATTLLAAVGLRVRGHWRACASHGIWRCTMRPPIRPPSARTARNSRRC